MELVQTAVTVFLFFFILGSLVVFHELGHFVTARLAGVRVLEFGIGFPPRAKVLRSGGETLYTLNWLPIGGFVRLEGEDGDDGDDPRSFVNAGIPKRLVILLAGVGMNLLAAFLIFTSIAWLATPLVGARIVDGADPGSPAEQIGLEAGDAIRRVDGEAFEFYGPSLVQVLRDKAGQTVTLEVDRASGERETLTVTLRPPEQVGPRVGPLGIGVPIADYYGEYVGRDFGEAVGIGATETLRWFGLILAGLGQIVGSFIADPTAPPQAAGPVGIATQIGDVFFNAGPILTLYVAAILSANLALVNALPFPPLDGGRMLMIVLKRVFGQRISLRAERLTYVVGFVFLFAFLIWVTGFDIARGLGGGATQ
jgi:regulator of sigma E protease